MDFFSKLYRYVIAHKYFFFILFLLLLSILFRFYNFADKWGLSGDAARDAMIGKEALMRHEVPLYGSFSSAGPFVFGPLFYWFIMVSFIILPFTFAAPWILTGVASVVVVGTFIYLGYLLGGKKLSIILGILSATSAHLIVRAVILGQHTFITLCTTLLLIFFVLLWQKQKFRYAFFMGVALGVALSMHYEAINLFIFFLVILCAPAKKISTRFFYLLSMLGGFLIPSLPLLYWDAQQHFANIRNIMDYFFIGQYRLYVPNSWTLFVFQFLPSYWSFVIGGNIWLGVDSILVTAVTTITLLVKKRVKPLTVVLGVVFLIFLILQRYYHGERSEGYLLYIDPFILLFVGISVSTFFEKHVFMRFPYAIAKAIGITCITFIVIGNMIYAWQLVNITNNVQVMEHTLSTIEEKYPHKKIALYDYKWQTGETSMMLSALLEIHNVSDIHGQPIGFIGPKAQIHGKHARLGVFGEDSIVTLSAEDAKNRSLWTPMNHEAVYDDLMQWMKGKKLTSTFYLDKFVKSKLHIQ